MDPILILGSSGHARVVIDIVEREGRHRIAGLVDSFRSPGETTLGYSVLGTDAELPALLARHGAAGVLVAVGHNGRRSALVERLRALVPGLRFPRAVHPAACLGRGVTLGEGTVVMPGVVVNAGATVGRFCILNTGAVLEHDARMDDFASLAPGALTGGNARLGAGAALCLGARLVHRVSIGEHTVVGAGATVLEDLPAHCVAHGTPARVVRARTADDEYL